VERLVKRLLVEQVLEDLHHFSEERQVVLVVREQELLVRTRNVVTTRELVVLVLAS